MTAVDRGQPGPSVERSPGRSDQEPNQTHRHELDAIRVCVRADDGADELVVGVEAAVQTLLGWLDTHAYCADASLWISPRDNGGRPDVVHNRARIARRPGREVLVVGPDALADQVRAILGPGCAGWRLHELPAQQTFLEVAEPILGHRAHNMLTREGFRTLEEVAATPEASLLNIRNIGKKSLATIRDAIATHLPVVAPADVPLAAADVDASADLTAMTTDELRGLWTAVVWELERRGVLAIAESPLRGDSSSPSS